MAREVHTLLFSCPQSLLLTQSWAFHLLDQLHSAESPSAGISAPLLAC